MHLLTITSTKLDEMVEPVDLGQSPADIVVLSFADSDLSALAAAWVVEREALPSVRLAHLRDLRHPMSVDLWIERVGSHAKIIVVRLLGGLDWWRYGVEQLAALAKERAIALALLPGEDRDDPRLAEASTLAADELDSLLRFFRAGGRDNMRALLRRLAECAAQPSVNIPLPEGGRSTAERSEGRPPAGSLREPTSPFQREVTTGTAELSLKLHDPRPIPQFGAYLPRGGILEVHRLAEQLMPGRPVVPIIFYRALLLASDTAAIDALCAALTSRGLAPAPLFVTSLKETTAQDFIRAALARLSPAVILTTTAFAIANESGESTVLDAADVPVLQIVIANTKRAAWRDSMRGLGAADLAMHVVLPELDGRMLAGAVSFKDALPLQPGLGFTPLANRPEPDRIDFVAERVAALARLQKTPRRERRLAIVMPDYAGAAGRAGYAVGLDVPASVLALLSDLGEAGYEVQDVPQTSRALLDALAAGCSEAALALGQYQKLLLATLPAQARERIFAAWGEPDADPDCRNGAFRFRARVFGNILVALPPDRGRAENRRTDYHDLTLPPRHALLAFGLWLQQRGMLALVHMGAHGTIEWLPGKAVALTSACFPEIITGPLPVIYPFIVSNPGEAAQAKRRIAAVTIGHLPPLLVTTGLSGAARELERLLDEYAQADGLDRKRRDRLVRLIVDSARGNEIANAADVPMELDGEEALRRLDAWLCDLKDLAVKDGLHVYGRAPSVENVDAAWAASVQSERAAILHAIDGRRVGPGPAGSPARGRRDVLPTGRNLFTADPRMLPTPTAMELGQIASNEVIRAYLQSHGEMPRALVIDLWGSATLRTGGEEIAQGLALMGCRPLWDQATGRVTGIEVLPTATMGRPRIDVTWRISGLFRDLFPAQIALMDAAVRAVAARDEADEDNPLAAAARLAQSTGAAKPARIFGNAPGAYGAGIEHLLGRKTDRDAIGAAYLASASHAYGGPEGIGTVAGGEFSSRIADADLLLHPSDDPARDLLEGAEDAAFIGGFAAAAAMLGRAPDLIMLDATDPQRPRARSLTSALARIVHGRAVNPLFIAGMMRHGPRGAAELAETVDRLVDFAETTRSVPSALLDLVHESYFVDTAVRDFLLRENPAAARAIAARLNAALHRGLWHPRRNDVTEVLP
jgi:cobaltochelatase CobN